MKLPETDPWETQSVQDGGLTKRQLMSLFLGGLRQLNWSAHSAWA